MKKRWTCENCGRLTLGCGRRHHFGCGLCHRCERFAEFAADIRAGLCARFKKFCALDDNHYRRAES